ncbi:hypothetical protein TEA_028605 [Camellia sinensis var. sinensis]|uniref:DNA topoisomerase (ATP-hydrolyzing) n=1 Tax=Camellia sinensis var. sinensis TaxID=542762 RepID=A0A4S4DH20_CAMSN|nr:hypothetical protein TEA_028605 [Camellia sinensis var. sinensis]
MTGNRGWFCKFRSVTWDIGFLIANTITDHVLWSLGQWTLLIDSMPVSFVNSIATIKGGTHVDYVTNQITNYVMSIVNKKNKNANLKAHAVKNHLWVFVNALIGNPAFDSQTKGTLTIRSMNLGRNKNANPCPILLPLLSSGTESAVYNNWNLQSNGLTGKLPSELGNFKYLEELRLDRNKLQGNVPATNSSDFTSSMHGIVDGGRPSSASIFGGGFVLGGIVVGALGCIYAPQISKALAGADRKDLMRKLPKFIYDEKKALERTRKILTEKIAQLNSAIDDVSLQLRADDTPNGTAVSPDELQASI